MTSAPDVPRSALDSKTISALAEKVTAEYYARDAGAIKRWGGEKGRKRTLEDTVFTLQHLSSAAFADDPGLFLDYFKWLIVVLTTRGVDLGVIMVHTEILIRELDGEKSRTDDAERKNVLERCMTYLIEGRALLNKVNKDPSLVGGFRYLA